MFEYASVCLNLLNWICSNLFEFACICMNLQKFARICKNLQEFARICKNLQEFAWICMNLLEFTWICLNLLKFAWISVDYALKKAHQEADIICWGRALLPNERHQGNCCKAWVAGLVAMWTKYWNIVSILCGDTDFWNHWLHYIWNNCQGSYQS